MTNITQPKAEPVQEPVAWKVRWLPLHNEPRGINPWVLIEPKAYKKNPGREEIPIYSVADLQAAIAAIAAAEPVDEQLRLDAELWRYAVKKGIVSIHSERIVDYDPETRCSWIQGHEKACDISNDYVVN